MAVGIASSAAAAAKANDAKKEARKKEEMIEAQSNKEQAFFDTNYYADVTKAADVQNIFRQLSENQKRQQSINDAKSSISGATDESKLAAQSSLNKSVSDAYAQVASDQISRKDDMANSHQSRQDSYFLQRLGMQDQLAGIEMNSSNQWAQTGAGAFQAGAGLLANGLGGLDGIGKTTTAPTTGLTKPDLGFQNPQWGLKYGNGNLGNPSSIGKGLDWNLPKPNWGIGKLK